MRSKFYTTIWQWQSILIYAIIIKKADGGVFRRSVTGRIMDINKYVPRYKVAHKSLLCLAQLSSEEIFEYLYAARAMKQKFRVREKIFFRNPI